MDKVRPPDPVSSTVPLIRHPKLCSCPPERITILDIYYHIFRQSASNSSEVQAKFYSNRLRLTPDLETEVHGLYACGDGAGITRGLVQASGSGLLAARAILQD